MDKKVLVLIVETMEKGVGRHIIDLYNNIALCKEIECYVLYGKDRTSDEYEEIMHNNNFIEIENLKRSVGLNDFKSIFEIRKKLLQIKPDIVHCHSSKAGLSGRIAAKLCHVKKILYSPHAYFFLNYEKGSLKRSVFLMAEKILSRFFTTYTISTSKGEKQVYLDNNIDKPEKTKLIEHGIEIEQVSDNQINKMRNDLNIPEDSIVVGAMARLEKQKNPIGIFKIMEQAVEREEKCYGLIFGNGSKYEELLELHKKSKYADRIIIAGETKEPSVALKLMDIYLTASLYEGLPYTIIEVLSQGKPIVVSDVEGNKDCVIEAKNGYKFEVKDYSQAAEYIEKIIKEDAIESMGKESLKIYEQRFSLEVMIKNYKNIYLGEE